MNRAFKPAAMLLSIGIAVLLPGGTAAPAEPEYDVKAALLYKIGKFVHWPDGAFTGTGGNLKLCVIGQNEFGNSIDSLAGKKLQGQIIVIQRMPALEAAVTECHIAFISRSETPRLPAILGALTHSPALTVSDIEGFALRGGMVGFATRDNKIRFEINPAAGKRSTIEVGAQLMQLATLVTDSTLESRP